MNFGEIKQEVQKNIIRKQQEITDLIPTWINRVQLEICRFHNFSFLRTTYTFTTTADTQQYSLPSDYKDDLSMWIQSDSYIPIQQLSYKDALRIFTPSDKGKPQYFVMLNGNIYFYPIPDNAYNILQEYYMYLPVLINDEDTNYITENFPDVLIKGAVAEGMIWLQEGDISIWLQRYQSALRDMIAYDQKRKLPSRFELRYSLGAKKSGIQWKG